MQVEFTRVETRQVCAGAYRGKDIEARGLLTHLVFMGADDLEVRAGCSQKLDHLVDTYGAEPEGTAPTCPRCAKI